ncbi:MAG TPA: stage V sporulation protein S [Firmicutes bacterium]|nr:stage V sporulation protein S [Bacillota bacterium]
MITLKVSAKSNPKSVAGSIVNNIREGRGIDIVAMGANAVNQTVKAIAIAGEYAEPEGYEILCKAGFTHLELEGETKSAVKIAVIVNKK